MASRLFHPELNGSLPEEAKDMLSIFRAPKIEQKNIFESIEECINCQESIDKDDTYCPRCGVEIELETE